jgi:hypothetical protein
VDGGGELGDARAQKGMKRHTCMDGVSYLMVSFGMCVYLMVSFGMCVYSEVFQLQLNITTAFPLVVSVHC